METKYFCKAIASLVIILTLMINSGCDGRGVGRSTNTEFIRSSCSATTYPKLCYSSLSSHAAAVQQNPKFLADAALSVSLASAVGTSDDMLELSHASGMTPREAGAMHDCVELLADSVDQLRRSIAELTHLKKGGSDFEMVMSDAQTWVSAALTDADTCMDGFAGKLMNGGVKAAVRQKIVHVAHLTSNALALINTYASSLHG